MRVAHVFVWRFSCLSHRCGQVVTLNKEKNELEAGLLPIQSENSSLKFRLIESEKVIHTDRQSVGRKAWGAKRGAQSTRGNFRLSYL